MGEKEAKRGELKMGKRIISSIVVFILIISMVPGFALASSVPQSSGETSIPASSLLMKQTAESLGAPSLEIVSPESATLYLFQLRPIPLHFAGLLGMQSAIVIGRSLDIDTISTDVHHAKFVATGAITKWETTRWDYQTIDGMGMDLGLKSGMYTIDVIGYNEEDQEVASDSINVVFLKIGRDDFGVWVNTQYDGGEVISTPLGIGITDFGDMINTGTQRQFRVPLQQNDDTTIDLRFIKTKILENSEKVIQTICAVNTNCDTTKDYEVSLEVRFPFIMLDGGQPTGSNNPYFSTSMGYHSFAATGSPNTVNFSFFVGRESLNDPRVFRLAMIPENIGEDSHLQFFTNYVAMNATGDEVFQRLLSLDFTPATELTITSIPREAKVQYDFGNSAGTTTTISFRAEGGILDDIIQRFTLDPLPSYMSFDLTVIGSREFVYESDQSYNIAYALDSEQNGNIVRFAVQDLPQTIHASWGLDLGTFGDLSASAFADLDMSSDVSSVGLFIIGQTRPLLFLQDFPRKLRAEGYIDIPDGTGNITLYRGLDDVRDITVALAFDEVLVTKSFDLKNNYLQMTWDIDLPGGTGAIDITRDSETDITLETTIEYQDWTFVHSLQLKNTFVHFSWAVDRVERAGRIVFSRDAVGGNPTLTFSIAHEDWTISDTIELRNEYNELYWDLATETNPHAEIGLIIGGEDMLYTTLSVVDASVEILRLGIGVSTQDRFFLSWDNNNGHLSNFEWSGRILELSGSKDDD